jgi:hypothetical protein
VHVSDLAVIVAGAAGVIGTVIGGTIGNFGLRRQAEAEDERVRWRQYEAFRKERQAAYQSFLETTYELYLHRTGLAPRPHAPLGDWVFRLNHVVAAVTLLGTPSAYGLADALASDIDRYMRGETQSAAPTWDDETKRRFMEKWVAAAESMRHDVAVSPPSRTATAPELRSDA